jgi:cation diffusion facilitator CzcD-associated flavoprotein CzcO
VPPIEELESFEGPAFHTAQWRHDVDLSGKRVAVVGTGCSAIQVVPAIQPEVAQLDVYQRSPGWTLPKMDFEYSARTHALFRRIPALRRLDRASVFAFQEFAAAALTHKRWLLPALRAVGRRQIKAAIPDPELRRKVTPSDEFGCKRIMLTDEWYPTLTEPNVDLVAERIEAVTPAGIRDATGVERPTDAIVLATGFASHDFVAPMEISGRAGRTLDEEWAEIARAYLGLSVPGFPNMFLLYGPNTNGGSGSVVNTLECGIGHVLAALREMESAGAGRIEVKPEAAEDFDRELRAALAKTVWHSGCSNWYVDENGNDPSNWPWIWSTYKRRTERLAPGAYELAETR